MNVAFFGRRLRPILTSVYGHTRTMATVRSSLPHTERTKLEPRENRLEPVILSHIREVNENIRILHLNAVDPSHAIEFLPGQWLDTFIPGLQQAGGFTITSTPAEARSSKHSPAFLELAVQKSKNPPAQWFWRPREEILGAHLVVRVGGSFTWPPPSLDISKLERLVLVAGGVGINPLVSIFSHVVRSPRRPQEVHFVYGTRSTSDVDPQSILFLPRLMDLAAAAADPGVTLSLFITGTGDDGVVEHGNLPNRAFARRVSEADLTSALDGYKNGLYGPEHDRKDTLCYVCGPSRFTDEIVTFLKSQPGMADERVLCEKWW